MEAIISAVNSTQSIAVSDNIKAVYQAILSLKKSNSVNEVIKFLETINFESPFEKLVAVKLINEFKLNNNLISAFATEDLFVISQSLKCDWFFESDGGFLLDKNLTSNFFSKLSYSGRCKVIRKYAKNLKNSDVAEKLFVFLEEMYGIGIALELIPACSEVFITDILYSKDVSLPDNIVLSLFRKYPDFTTDFIFSYFEKRNNPNLNGPKYSEDYRNTLLVLASEKTDLFIEFYNKYGSCVHLNKFGRSLTHKILKVGYPSVLRNVDLYCKILHVKHVVSYLNLSQIVELHFYSMPKTISKFNGSVTYYSKSNHVLILECLKSSVAEEILLKNFKKKFGKEPLDVDLNDDWIRFFPCEVRTKWVAKELRNPDISDSKKADLLTYIPFESAFDSLKSLMTTAADSSMRSQIIGCMMSCAKNNKTTDGASEIIKYVVARHRNDNSQVKGRPLDDLKNGFDLTKLTVEQWAPIVELFNILIINDEIISFTNELDVAYRKYIVCRLNAGLPVDSEMETLMKYMGYYVDFNIASGTEYERFCLNWFNDNITKKKFVNDRETNNYFVTLFRNVCSFNAVHPLNPIAHKDWILDVVKEKIDEVYSRGEIISSLKKDKALKSKLYNDVFPQVIFPELLLYKLNHNVNDITSNVEDIVKKIMNTSYIYSYKTFFQKIQLYVDLPAKFVDNCIKEINSDDEYNSVRYKENGIVILSMLNQNIFLSFIESYYPTSAEAETEGDEAQEKYRIQKTIAASLKNINPPYKALGAVKKFSIGDYLKLVVGSLFSVSLKISQAKALEFVKENLDSPMSYRKHVIRIFRFVASKVEVSNFLLNLIKSEKNVSMRIIIFNYILDFIKLEKSDLSWETIKQSFNLMSDVDFTQLKERIIKLNDIPLEYQPNYVETVWDTMSRLEVSVETKAKIFSLINENNIILLSDNFADHLFHLTYNKDDSKNVTNWNYYISLYLNHSSTEMYENRLNNVMSLIKNKFGKSIGKDADSVILLNNLIQSICRASLLDGVTIDSLKILSDVHSHLLKLFSEHDIHSTIFTLLLYQIFVKNGKSKNISGFADDVCSLVDLQCSTYSPYMVQVLSNHIVEFIHRNFVNDNTNTSLVFAHRTITGPTSPLNKVVGINALLGGIDSDNETESKLFKTIVDTIKSSPDVSLKIYARHVFKSL